MSPSDAPERSCSDWAGSLGKQQLIDEASHLERRTSTQALNRSILRALLPPPLPRSDRSSGQGCHIPWEEDVKQVIIFRVESRARKVRGELHDGDYG